MKKSHVLVCVAGLALGAAAPLSAQVLYDNGPLVTHPAGGAAGSDASALQTALALTVYGFGTQLAASNRMADDFAVPTGQNWNVTTVTLFSYQTGAVPPAPTINHVNLQIWNGPPNAGGTVIWGDTTTNRLATASFPNIYRVLDTGLTNTQRATYKLDVTIGTSLPAGTYWLDWQIGGTLASGPWQPPVSILGQTAKPGANALQSLVGVWGAALDGTFAQDMPFIVNGSGGGGGGCYANCDASTNPPCLNVNDFVCFNNLYAAASPLANCDASTNPPTLNVNDFVCFNNAYAASCTNPCAAP